MTNVVDVFSQYFQGSYGGTWNILFSTPIVTPLLNARDRVYKSGEIFRSGEWRGAFKFKGIKVPSRVCF